MKRINKLLNQRKETPRRKTPWLRRTAALVCMLAVLCPMMVQSVGGVESVDVLSQAVDGTILLFKWRSIYSIGEIEAGEHYVALLSEKSTSIGYADGGSSWSGGKYLQCRNPWLANMGFYFSEWNFPHNQICYSVGSMGSPIMWWDGSSKDGSNIDCPQVSMVYCNKDGDPKYAINRNGDYELSGGALNNGDGAYNDYARKLTTNTRTKDLGQFCYDNNWWSVCYPSKDSGRDCFCFFKNLSAKRDPGWKIDGDKDLWCEQDKDWEDYCYFNLFIGEPTLYSTLTRDYWVKDNSTLNLNAEEESNAGVYIPKGITLTVEKGGTLCINETCYNDGTIICDGGTIVIQEKGKLCPFASDGMNKIIVKNDGVLINMAGGRVYTTADYPIEFAESRLINFGTFVTGGNLYLYSSFAENREGGNLLIGYDYNDKKSRPNFASADLNGAGWGSINGMSEKAGKIVTYDTQSHYVSYGVLTNDGSMPGFSQTTDINQTFQDAAALKETLYNKGLRNAKK